MDPQGTVAPVGGLQLRRTVMLGKLLQGGNHEAAERAQTLLITMEQFLEPCRTISSGF